MIKTVINNLKKHLLNELKKVQLKTNFTINDNTYPKHLKLRFIKIKNLNISMPIVANTKNQYKKALEHYLKQANNANICSNHIFLDDLQINKKDIFADFTIFYYTAIIKNDINFVKKVFTNIIS